MKTHKIKIDWWMVVWVGLCCIIGLIGWLIDNPELEHPLWVWLIAGVFLESALMALFLFVLLPPLISLFIKNYNPELYAFDYLITILFASAAWIALNIYFGIQI